MVEAVVSLPAMSNPAIEKVISYSLAYSLVANDSFNHLFSELLRANIHCARVVLGVEQVLDKVHLLLSAIITTFALKAHELLCFTTRTHLLLARDNDCVALLQQLHDVLVVEEDITRH